jgi:hypothetical protein
MNKTSFTEYVQWYFRQDFQLMWVLDFFFFLSTGDQKVSVHLTITVQKNTQKYSIMKIAITEYIRNVDCAILNTVFENTVQRVNKCLETGGGHCEHYL